MDEVSSPRITVRRPGLRLGVAAGLLALTGGLAVTPAAAEDLGALRESAAAAASQRVLLMGRALAAVAAARQSGWGRWRGLERGPNVGRWSIPR